MTKTDRARLAALSATGKDRFARREIAEALSCFQEHIEGGGELQQHASERWACWMMLGEFENAWKESDLLENRKCIQLTDQRVVVRCLRGLGDAIQFLRYVPLLKRCTRALSIQAPDRLLPLLRFVPGIEPAIALDGQLPPHDLQIECSELPYLFRTTLATIPAPLEMHGIPKLGAFPSADRINIGLTWQTGEWNPTRSVPFPMLLQLAEIPGIALYSLQRGAQDLVHPYADLICDAEPPGGNIIQTTSVIQALDLVISADTMVAHLAGSLGKPVWTLLQHACDWRWMLDRTDSPWYPSMRLFRQGKPGDWESVLRDVAARLRRTD